MVVVVVPILASDRPATDLPADGQEPFIPLMDLEQHPAERTGTGIRFPHLAKLAVDTFPAPGGQHGRKAAVGIHALAAPEPEVTRHDSRRTDDPPSCDSHEHLAALRLDPLPDFLGRKLEMPHIDAFRPVAGVRLPDGLPDLFPGDVFRTGYYLERFVFHLRRILPHFIH